MRAITASAASARTKNKTLRNIRKYLPFYFFMLPGLIYLICNNYLPMYGITIAFKKLNFAKGILGSPWCGLDNFKFLFKSGQIYTILRNTLLYNLVMIPLGMMLSVACAIVLNEVKNKFASRVYQSIILIPSLMSWVVINYIAYAFLNAENGVINTWLTDLGLQPISWYTESAYWPVIIVLVSMWKTVGNSMIVYLASIVGISSEYYEAAKLDGASKWQQIWNITLPMLKPTMITLLILSLGGILHGDFGLFYQLPRNSSALYGATETLDVFVFNALMKQADYGMSSAASVFSSVVGFVLVIVSNKVSRKVDKDMALF